jgi:hypothetical protein
MEKDVEPEVKFFESELDLCNAFLDIARAKAADKSNREGPSGVRKRVALGRNDARSDQAGQDQRKAGPFAGAFIIEIALGPIANRGVSVSSGG